ncbi:hypothetical protein CRG98_018857 [Punica granatum]|uniref:Uncharacterized protein n=1 Tax=Punica granatum TaxID=22663 RepID=A0A2I0JWP2_PUNGR|nr:hypothetical protein CRG98_018857 [Punica granatum]
MLPFAFLAYQTSIHSSTGATPYFLAYDMEAILLVEVEIPSMRVLVESKLEEVEWAKQRYEQLNLIDEKCLTSLYHGQYYQQRMARAFNAKVRHCKFHQGNLVLRKVLHIALDSMGKFAYMYDGPFIVKETFSGGVIILNDMSKVGGRRLLSEVPYRSLLSNWDTSEVFGCILHSSMQLKSGKLSVPHFGSLFQTMISVMVQTMT